MDTYRDMITSTVRGQIKHHNFSVKLCFKYTAPGSLCPSKINSNASSLQGKSSLWPVRRNSCFQFTCRLFLPLPWKWEALLHWSEDSPISCWRFLLTSLNVQPKTHYEWWLWPQVSDTYEMAATTKEQKTDTKENTKATLPTTVLSFASGSLVQKTV